MPTGTYALRVKATSGSITRTANLSLTVDPPSGGQTPSSVTLTVMDTWNVGYTVAFQVENGNWTAQNRNPNHTYTLDLNGQSRYGVAVYCSQDQSLHIVQATTTELPNLQVTCGYSPVRSQVPYTLNLDVSQTGAQADDRVFVQGSYISHSGTSITSPSSVQASISAPEGAQDMLIVVARLDPNNPLSQQILHAEVLRNVNVTSGGSSTYTLGSPLGTNTVTLSNVPQGFSSPHPYQPFVFYASGLAPPILYSLAPSSM